MKEPVTLKLTAAVVIGGAIHRAGTLVEVEDVLARNLLDRRKAELATDKNTKADASQEDDGPDAAELAAIERAMKDNGMTADEFAALSNTKRKALTKQAADAIAKENA